MSEKKKETAIVKKKTEEITQAPPQGIGLFGAKSPAEVIKEASAIATAVSGIIEKQKLFSIIQGNKYVHCEGWTTMGALLGVYPQIVEIREERKPGIRETQTYKWNKKKRIREKDKIIKVEDVKYIAVCEVRTLAGNLVGRAEAECSSWESKRYSQKNDDYIIRSMAQTRVTGKAMRLPLSWIMVLAGYAPTPKEEMDGVVTLEPQKDEFTGDLEYTEETKNLVTAMKDRKEKEWKDAEIVEPEPINKNTEKALIALINTAVDKYELPFDFLLDELHSLLGVKKICRIPDDLDMEQAEKLGKYLKNEANILKTQAKLGKERHDERETAKETKEIIQKEIKDDTKDPS